jgi:hypothetical protein
MSYVCSYDALVLSIFTSLITLTISRMHRHVLVEHLNSCAAPTGYNSLMHWFSLYIYVPRSPDFYGIREVRILRCLIIHLVFQAFRLYHNSDNSDL